jgi:glycosyltransferase involved in cell wall biosynthesis
VNTVQIWKLLRRHVRTLLISPVEPLFNDASDGDVITLERLRRTRPEISYFSFVHLVRSVISSLETKLLLISHRSQSLFLFDLIKRFPSVIYCDGFADSRFALGEALASAATDDDLLRELYFVLSASPPDFFGFLSDLGRSLDLLTIGSKALHGARENWCWGDYQTNVLADAVPSLRDRIRFVPPFTDTSIFDVRKAKRGRHILFTTTMHNIDKKGLPELLRAMGRLPGTRTRCVLRQPERAPRETRKFRDRLTLETLPRPRMIDAYHTAWLNCRVSREESSPVSILEAMACELPQVVSPAVARQIPIIEDGVTGFVVDPDDNDGLCRALRTILGDSALRDRMGRKCRERVLSYDINRRKGEVLRFL